MEEPVTDYAFSEFVEAFRHAGTQTGNSETGGEFVGRWFAARYFNHHERKSKFDILMAVLEYLAEHRDEFDAARLNVSGSEKVGTWHTVYLSVCCWGTSGRRLFLRALSK